MSSPVCKWFDFNVGSHRFPSVVFNPVLFVCLFLIHYSEGMNVAFIKKAKTLKYETIK